MDTGELITRASACAALVAYVAALALRMVGRSALSRVCWSLGAVILALHVVCAFQFVHHWSHAAAYESTARQTSAMTGWSSGSGLYLNYLLVLVWCADAVWWWKNRQGYEARATSVNRAVQGFLAFMWFNASVVFGHGPARWLGVAAIVLLVGVKLAISRRK